MGELVVWVFSPLFILYVLYTHMHHCRTCYDKHIVAHVELSFKCVAYIASIRALRMFIYFPFFFLFFVSSSRRFSNGFALLLDMLQGCKTDANLGSGGRYSNLFGSCVKLET